MDAHRWSSASLLAAGGLARLMPNTVPLAPDAGTALSIGGAVLLAAGLVVLGARIGRTGGAAVIVAGALILFRLDEEVLQRAAPIALGPVPDLVVTAAGALALLTAAVALAADRSLRGTVRRVLLLPAAAMALVLVLLAPVDLVGAQPATLPWLGELPDAAWLLAGVLLLVPSAQEAGSRLAA